MLPPSRLPEERFPDLLLGGRWSEDDDPVPHLELRVAVGVEDRALASDRPELLLDPERAAAIALDDHHLVPRLQEGLREVIPDLASAGDDEVHQRVTVGRPADSSSSCFIAAFMRFGPMVLSPDRTAWRSVARIVVREKV